MKAKRLFSFLLALVMLLSLSPVPALAEETGESPAFLVQSVSGSRAAGESYVLTWALNRTPDRLELVREATEEEGAAEGVGPYDGDGPVLVLVQELEPERTRLEMPAAEEETIFYLRAFYGEEELLSVGFTVTLDAEEDDTSSGADAPPSPQGEGKKRGKAGQGRQETVEGKKSGKA